MVGLGPLACGYSSPATIDPAAANLLGCYDVTLHGWTPDHTARLGFRPPGHIRLHEREVSAVDLRDSGVEGFDPGSGGADGRLLLPVSRDVDSRWGWLPSADADSVSLHWGSLNVSVDAVLPVPADGRTGVIRWWPVDVADDLGGATLGLDAARCAQ